MLKDQLSTTEEIETQYGVCKFCGQRVAIHPLFPWDDDKLNECASEICGCPSSQVYAKTKNRLERADKIIDRKFNHGSPEDDYNPENCLEVCELLKHIAKAVSKETIISASVKLTGTMKCSISLNGDGSKIKIKRSSTYKDEEEA